MRAILEGLSNGFQIVAAASGTQALEKAGKQAFDLVITDVRMPGMDGIELTEAIRGLSTHTVMIWITAYGCEKLKSERERLNIHICLEKPLRLDQIRRAALDALKANMSTGKANE
jgi:CheY-like chemotaxis protein